MDAVLQFRHMCAAKLPTFLVTMSTASLILGACSTGSSELPKDLGASTNPGTAGATASSTVPVGSTGGGGSSSIGINPSGAGNAGIGSETVVCTEGEDCTCPTLAVAVIGKPGKWGANPAGDSDTAFQEWLNSSSAGTAKADVYASKPTLTPEFLAPYNVIILASLAEDSNIGPFWSFNAAEVAAFQDWVENQGGGVIALMGYSGDGGETKPANQLLAFSGVSYNTDSVHAACTDWRVCGCAGSKMLSGWNKSDPVIANLSNSVTWVGLENGRSINAPADAHVAATIDGPFNVLVGKIAGKGRVLAYADEWITYTSQWTGQGVVASNCTPGYMPQDVYQTAQFWFNMIKWTQPSATCFKIVDKEQPVTIW